MTRIAICAPARPITRAIADAVTALATMAVPRAELSFHPQCFVEQGHFAGDDATRLGALLQCADDPAFEAVWIARGGYGSNRIAAGAVAAMGPAAREKAFLGYSDGGYLLAELYRAGIGRPAHGPMPVDCGKPGGEEAVRRALGWLCGDDVPDMLEPSLDRQPAVAFNLTTLAMLAGTPLMPKLAGHVVMVEEVAEHLYAIDRLFFTLMPHLTGIAGLRLGRVSAVPENDRPFGVTAEQIAREWCRRAGVPFLGPADIGHDAANRVVPFGLASPPPAP
ncbi:carboxypeptidase [Croceibacterium mercuriale]|uniref:Carboxypeptidase n=1 Tax=Croceibacterium mercuriale TaxID=1572751 RepID=A0A0B2C3I0_9SPHN|nr:LD-carboxypeptidase [Croceibacterium mercuriale]KHL26725.1 carboxypeptidase [Croceibacterium mercuriale]